MARLPRLFLRDAASHVRIRGVDGRDIFRSDGDRLCFLAWLAQAGAAHGVAFHAYVLMTNHVHLLATGREAGSLPKAIQSVGRRYVAYFNHRYARTGTLWEGRYRSTLVQNGRYAVVCHRYIELNPVRAGMVSHPAEYLWSSHRRNALGFPDDLLTPHPALLALGADGEERLRIYRTMCAKPLRPQTIERLRHATRKGWVLGDRAFCERVQRQTGRRPLPRCRRGRPRRASS